MPSVNETFIATVRDVATDGNGVIEHSSGQVFFVAGVWMGEKVECRITGFKKRYGFAELLAVIDPSPLRITPQCKYQGFGSNNCGGCPWQFMAYEAQLAAKEHKVKQALARMGLQTAVQPIWASPQEFGYRNRAQLKSDGVRLGYVAMGSSQLVDVDKCPVLSEHNGNTLTELRSTLPNSQFRPRKKSQWTTIDIDEDMSAADIVINRRRPFRQANSAQNQRMQQWLAQSLANVATNSPVLELFSGSGNFTRILASAGFDNIIAVEGVEEAVQALQRQGLPGVNGQVADLFSATAVKKIARDHDTRLLVLDPPRDGFRHIDVLLDASPKLAEVRYISCDLATFCRDIAVFTGRGFSLTDVQPLDQFPHTPHVEILASLTKL